MAVGDLNCPKCGAQMEQGHMRVIAERGFGLWFKPEILPWKEPPEKVEEKNIQKKQGDRLLGSMFNYESDVHRCPKCRLILLGY